MSKLAIIHINAWSEADEFGRLLRGHLACPERIIVAELTPGLSLYGGSGLMGVTIVTNS